MNIKFIYQDLLLIDFNEDKIRRWIISCIAEENKKLSEINYEFVSEETILKINKEFLNHDYYTDIITFDESLVNIIKGHIFISPATVKSNAKNNATSYEIELYRVIIHGIMHLCGYKDSSEEEKKLMRLKENTYLCYLEKI